jgi:hypothetical protein
VLVRTDSGWRMRRQIDLRSYVHPGWDESYNPCVYSKGRWKKVKVGLEQYCDRRHEPQVIEMHRRYRTAERPTVVQDVVIDLVAAGELPDPEQFSLDANCPPLDRNPDVEDLHAAATSTASAPASSPISEEEWTERIIAHEMDTERRTVRTAALRLSYPQVVSGSIGWISTRQPRDYDCRTPCDLWGVFGQIEPGLGGGKASLGYGRVIGEQRKGPFALSSVFLAMGIKGSVLHTWGDQSQLPSNQTYVGPEFEFSVARVNMGIGALARVSGDDGRRWVITGYLGWGF